MEIETKNESPSEIDIWREIIILSCVCLNDLCVQK